jgi:hypothetical protein
VEAPHPISSQTNPHRTLAELANGDPNPRPPSSSWPTTYPTWPGMTSGCCSSERSPSAAESSCQAQLPSTHSANSPVPLSTTARPSSAGSASSRATTLWPERGSSVSCRPASASRNPHYGFGCRGRYVELCFHVGCPASHPRSSNQCLPPLRLTDDSLVHAAGSIGRRRAPPVRPLRSRDDDPGGRRPHRPRVAQPAS